MNHIAPRPEPLIREIPLSRLALAPENVRKTPADPVAEAENEGLDRRPRPSGEPRRPPRRRSRIGAACPGPRAGGTGAYEAAEAAAVLFLQRYGRAMRANAGAGADGPRRMLAMLDAVAALEPSHTRRSEEQVRLQQFSTPLPLAYAALQAAAIRPGDTVLEPSAGTGMLAVMAQCALGKGAAGKLHLNEYARARARLLTRLFPQAVVTAFDAEAIADRLHDVRPTVVLMNPPFSATPGVDRIRRRWCSPPPWRPCRIRRRHTGRCCPSGW